MPGIFLVFNKFLIIVNIIIAIYTMDQTLSLVISMTQTSQQPYQ